MAGRLRKTGEALRRTGGGIYGNSNEALYSATENIRAITGVTLKLIGNLAVKTAEVIFNDQGPSIEELLIEPDEIDG